MLRLLPPPEAQGSRDVDVARPYDLAIRPQRPGELTSTVVVELDREARQHVAERSRTDAVPPTLWLTIAIEAERTVQQIETARGCSRTGLTTALDRAAAIDETPTTLHPSAAFEQLRSYAMALQARQPATSVLIGTSLPLSPSLHAAAAWALEADRQDIDVSTWASAQAARLLPGRVSWEVASALEAQTLAEWMLRQATRRERSTSTSAHSRARG